MQLASSLEELHSRRVSYGKVAPECVAIGRLRNKRTGEEELAAALWDFVGSVDDEDKKQKERAEQSADEREVRN